MHMTDPHALAGLTWGKVSTMFVLGGGTVMAAQIGDPNLERYVSLGVGGALAATIFYFYRRQEAEFRLQASEFSKSKDAAADAYRVQAALLIVTLQESARVNAQLSATVAELRTAITELNHEQRERYEQDLRDGGRRTYDPSRIPKRGDDQ